MSNEFQIFRLNLVDREIVLTNISYDDFMAICAAVYPNNKELKKR